MPLLWDTTKGEAKPDKGVGGRTSMPVCCLQPRNWHVSGLPSTFHAFALSHLQEKLLFFEEGSVQHVRELLPGGDTLLFLVLLLSLMQNNIHSG